MVSTSSELKNGIRLRPRRRRRSNQRQDYRESCEVVPGWFVHRLRLTDPAQLDNAGATVDSRELPADGHARTSDEGDLPPSRATKPLRIPTCALQRQFCAGSGAVDHLGVE